MSVVEAHDEAVVVGPVEIAAGLVAIGAVASGHGIGAVDREIHEFTRVLVELRRIAPGQKICIACYHPQRFLQIVRRHTDNTTFELRDGLKFHDGAPVRSADCIASIDRWSKRDALGQKLGEATKMLECIKVTLLASLNGYASALAVEFGRKVLYSTERPSFVELENHVKRKPAAKSPQAAK